MKDKISSEDFIKAFGNGVKDNREITLNTESRDCISREALKEDLFIKFGNQLPNGLLEEIDKAPTVSDRYDEGYAQGYVDGSTGADWKGGAE